ncbi:hypothetical protein OHD37_25120, partial [Escherichia coli]|nr:hypothetical protein [Escherichia coli]
WGISTNKCYISTSVMLHTYSRAGLFGCTAPLFPFMQLVFQTREYLNVGSIRSFEKASAASTVG